MGASSESWPDPVFRHADSAPAPLGIGLLLTPALRLLAEQLLDGLDFVAVAAADFWPDADPVSIERSTSIHAATRLLDVIAEDRPLVAHGWGAALAAAHPPDARSLARILEWQARYRFAWIGALLLPEPGTFAELTGLPDRHASVGSRDLPWIVERVRTVRASLPMPLLLENGTWPLRPPVRDASEPALLNAVCAATGCGIVLDLRSLSINALDCGIDALAFLDSLDLDRVVEVQVGVEPRRVTPGIPVPVVRQPPTVLELLDAMLWRAPGLRAITVDVRGPDPLFVDEAAVDALLAAVRGIWNLYR